MNKRSSFRRFLPVLPLLAGSLLVAAAVGLPANAADARQATAAEGSFTLANLRHLNAVQHVEVEYRTPLAERKWHLGVSGTGVLHKLDNGALLWRLRGYGAQSESAGINAGVMHRHVVDDDSYSLIGMNFFTDFEQNGKYDSNFWRFSAGMDYRNERIHMHFNRYLAEDGANLVRDGRIIYSRDGYDMGLRLHLSDSYTTLFNTGFTYYRWTGQYGDENDSGVRHHLSYSPSRFLRGLDMTLEVDVQGLTRHGSKTVHLGGILTYRHVLGARPGQDAAPDSEVNPGDFLYEPETREYTQRTGL